MNLLGTEVPRGDEEQGGDDLASVTRRLELGEFSSEPKSYIGKWGKVGNLTNGTERRMVAGEERTNEMGAESDTLRPRKDKEAERKEWAEPGEEGKKAVPTDDADVTGM